MTKELIRLQQKIKDMGDKVMIHNVALHEETRKEIQVGFTNQIHQFSLNAKELFELRKKQARTGD